MIIHSDKDIIILVHWKDSFSFSLTATRTTFTLNWTFKVPRMVREVLIGLHKSRCAHREPGVYTVIGEVVMQVAFQEFMHLKLYNINRKRIFRRKEEKNSLFPPKDLLLGESLAASEYPQGVTISAARTKRQIKMAVKNDEGKTTERVNLVVRPGSPRI
jgi:hypothetical protein